MNVIVLTSIVLTTLLVGSSSNFNSSISLNTYININFNISWWLLSNLYDILYCVCHDSIVYYLLMRFLCLAYCHYTVMFPFLCTNLQHINFHECISIVILLFFLTIPLFLVNLGFAPRNCC